MLLVADYVLYIKVIVQYDNGLHTVVMRTIYMASTIVDI